MKQEKVIPKFLELKPNVDLLDGKFNGYKLSLNSLPAYKIPISSGIFRTINSDDQYSLQHFKIFASKNHIHPDPWSTKNDFYFIDDELAIYKQRVESPHCTTESYLQERHKVWEIVNSKDDNKLCPVKTGRFHINILFPNEEYAMVSDGLGNLFILETFDRIKESNDWKLAYSGSPFNDFKSPNSTLLEAIFYQKEGDNKSYIDALVLSIDLKSDWEKFMPKEKYRKNRESVFVTLIHWMTFSKDVNNEWDLTSRRVLVGQGSINYASIENFGSGIVIASDAEFNFAIDSENQIEPVEIEKTPNYLWMQNDSEVTIFFNTECDNVKDDLLIEFNTKTINAKVKDKVILNGNFPFSIKSDESLWTFTSNKIEIVITKANSGIRWENVIIESGNGGEEILDPLTVEEIQSRLESLNQDANDFDNKKVFNFQELEDCDDCEDVTGLLVRFDRELQKATHQVNLDNRQWLFNLKRNSENPPAFVVRDDVDGLVWEPCDSQASNWSCIHIGTFLALGYVQASKSQRKFTVAPADLSYATICDDLRHIYLYRQPSLISTELRNRKTGQRISHVAHQHVIALDPPEEILGAYATNEYLFILTPQFVTAIRVKEENDA